MEGKPVIPNEEDILRRIVGGMRMSDKWIWSINGLIFGKCLIFKFYFCQCNGLHLQFLFKKTQGERNRLKSEIVFGMKKKSEISFLRYITQQ